MAGKPLNRLDLRRQREAAEPLDPMEDETDEAAEEVEEVAVADKKPKKSPSAGQIESEVVAVGQTGRADAHRLGRLERRLQARRHIRVQPEGSRGVGRRS